MIHSKIPALLSAPWRYVHALIAYSALAAACAPSFAQAPVAQSSFAQYVPKLVVGAGTGTLGKTGDGGPASSAQVNTPWSLQYDAAGNLYFCDMGGNVVRRIDAITGNISTVAGTTTGFSGDNGPAITAQLAAPSSVYVDTAGNLYIADTTNNRIRMVSAATGLITTIIGNATSAAGADGQSGPSTSISLPNNAWVSPQGDIFFSANNFWRVLVASGPDAGTVRTIAGTGTITSTGDGGPALSATFKGPRFGSVTSRGDYILTDRMFDEIRIIPALPFGTMTPGNIYDFAGISGIATPGYTGDGGPATLATVNLPNSTAGDAFGNTFIVDSGNNVIRSVDRTSGNISTLSYVVGGKVTTGGLLTPTSIAFAPNGTFAIGDSGNHEIRFGTFANTFSTTFVGGTSAATTFTLQANNTDVLSAPSIGAGTDFAVGTTGTCVAGAAAALSNCTVPVSFTPTAPGMRISQLVTTDTTSVLNLKAILPLIGIGNAPAVAITPGILTPYANTSLLSPSGAAFDSAGNLYTANADNTVRMISPSGTVTTLAGTGTAGNSGDGGLATAATLNAPGSVAVDPSGNVLIADTGNNSIREVSAEGGVINTISFFNPSALLTSASVPNSLLKSPKDVATDMYGNIYIADTGNNVVRRLTRGGSFYSILAGTVGTAGFTGDRAAATAALLNAPAGVFVDPSGNVFIADTGNNVIREISASTGIITTVAGSKSATVAGDGGLATAAQLNAPTRITVDPAGDLYIADSGDNKVRYVSASTGIISTIAGSGTASPLAGNGGLATAASLNAPAGVALDQFSNLYIADTGNGRIAKVGATTTSLNLGNALQGKTSAPTVVALTNFGNTPLILSSVVFTAQFAQSFTTGNDCSASTLVASGASCLIGVVFSPTTVGPVTGTLTITDNALNKTGATQVISLTGTGSDAPAAITPAGGNNQTTTPYAPFPASLAATVVDSTNAVVSNVAVTFTAPATGVTGTFSNGTNIITVNTNAGGVASAPLTAGSVRGTFTVTAAVSGVTTPASFTETIAGNPAPVVTIAYSPTANPATYGTPLTLTATLSPATLGGNSVTGVVTFLDNGTPIGTGTVSSGTAKLTLTPVAGSHSYTATYGGDTNFSTSTSATPATLTVNQLGITATATSVSFVLGSVVPTITGTLQGVLPADAANVTATFFGITTAGGSTPVNALTPPGVYPISETLSGSAAANYVVTSTGGSVTITQAATTSVLTYTPSYNLGATTSVTFTDVVTPSTSGTTAGTVTFTDNGPLGLVALGTSTKSGTFTYTGALALGTHVITATYVSTIPAGSTLGNYTGSVSNSVTIVIVNPIFTMTPSATSVNVVQGQLAQLPFVWAANGGYTSLTTFTCAGQPANAICNVTPYQVTPGTGAGTTGTTAMVTVQTEGPGQGFTTSLNPPAAMHGEGRSILYAALGILPALGFFLVSFRRGRKTRQRLAIQALLVMLSIAGFLPMTGCSGGTTSTPLVAQTTPVGTSTVTVTASSPTGTVATFTFTLNVTKAP